MRPPFGSGIRTAVRRIAIRGEVAGNLIARGAAFVREGHVEREIGKRVRFSVSFSRKGSIQRERHFVPGLEVAGNSHCASALGLERDYLRQW